MGMNSASSVSLISLSAAQGIPVRHIITWQLDIREAGFFLAYLKSIADEPPGKGK